jgi:hypothetical protein
MVVRRNLFFCCFQQSLLLINNYLLVLARDFFSQLTSTAVTGHLSYNGTQFFFEETTELIETYYICVSSVPQSDRTFISR